MKRNPWLCTGDGKITHPQTENYEDKCSVPYCTNKSPYTDKSNNRLFWASGVALAGVITLFLLTQQNGQSKFFYGGATNFAPIRSEENEKIIENIIRRRISNFDLVYKEPPDERKPGSETGIKMLIEGELSFSQSSSPLRTKDIEEAKARGFSLKQIPVAIDAIAVYLNPDLNISGLTLKQLREVFIGKITNWSQVGGPDLSVIPFSLSPYDAKDTADFFQREVMGGRDFASNHVEVRDPTTAIRKVSATSGGIGYASASLVCNQRTIKPIALAKRPKDSFVKPCINQKVNKAVFGDGSYPITSRMFVVIRQDNSPDEKAGLAYARMLLSNEGQDLMEQAGFVPISETSKSPIR